MTKSRYYFERFMVQSGESVKRCADEPEHYEYMHTAYMWLAWQAAWKKANSLAIEERNRGTQADRDT